MKGVEPTGDFTDPEPLSALARLAGRLTRVLLRLYPSSFCVDVGGALTRDVERLANEKVRLQGRLRACVWLNRHIISMLANALFEWKDQLMGPPGVRSYSDPSGVVALTGPNDAKIRTFSGTSLLDVKLGLRMLVKYPGLSLVSVAGLAVAIAIGAGAFGLVRAFLDGELPFDEGERIVAVQNSDVRSPGNPDRRVLHEFLAWRAGLQSVIDLSAFNTDRTTLAEDGGVTAEVSVARMTASGFRVARVLAHRGRTLQEEDEELGAPPVVVIGHAEWLRWFGGSPDVVGRTVRLGQTMHTIVGVMPPTFRFPVNHGFWVPLHLDPAAHQIGAGPEITLFGRIAPGLTVEMAQSELTASSGQVASMYPTSRAHIRPVVIPYVRALMGIDGPARTRMIRPLQMVLSLLLVAVAANVAILVYARTAARKREIAIRSALGASRRRVITQLFAEALVLSGTAALLGIALAALGFDWYRSLVLQISPDAFPFWITLQASPGLVLYVVGLAIVAAIIIGVLPAIKATGRSTQRAIQELHSTGSSQRLGGAWTGLIIIQVAITVAVLPIAVEFAVPMATRGTAVPDYAVNEFLRASISVGDEPEAGDGTLDDSTTRSQTLEQLLRRLGDEPGVQTVTFASQFPGEEGVVRLEVEGIGENVSVWLNHVDIGLFKAFGVPVVAGREFFPSEGGDRSSVAVVDRVFVEDVLGGGNVLGQMIRISSPSDDGMGGPEGAAEWLQVVGVISDFTVPPGFQPAVPKVYLPLALGEAPRAVHVAVRTRPGTSPGSLISRVREIAASVDPAIRIRGLKTATAAELERTQLLSFGALVVAGITSSTLLLAAAGIFAMMSFVVVSRRREIGIRSSLGAGRSQILTAIFRRAAIQLGAGVGVGLATAELVARMTGSSLVLGQSAHVALTVAFTIALVGIMATVGPALGALAVQPTEALRAD